MLNLGRLTWICSVCWFVFRKTISWDSPWIWSPFGRNMFVMFCNHQANLRRSFRFFIAVRKFFWWWFESLMYLSGMKSQKNGRWVVYLYHKYADSLNKHHIIYITNIDISHIYIYIYHVVAFIFFFGILSAFVGITLRKPMSEFYSWNSWRVLNLHIPNWGMNKTCCLGFIMGCILWWKKSCTAQHVWNPANNGILYLPYQLVQDFFHQQH